RDRVDAGIGASCAMHGGFLAGDPRHRFLDRLLYARPVRLALPAHERAAVEFDGEGEAGQASRVPLGTARPRRSSAASIAGLPARCSRTVRIAPGLHATVSASSRVTPGAAPATVSAGWTTSAASNL